jgi:hypothetical protein
VSGDPLYRRQAARGSVGRRFTLPRSLAIRAIPPPPAHFTRADGAREEHSSAMPTGRSLWTRTQGDGVGRPSGLARALQEPARRPTGSTRRVRLRYQLLGGANPSRAASRPSGSNSRWLGTPGFLADGAASLTCAARSPVGRRLTAPAVTTRPTLGWAATRPSAVATQRSCPGDMRYVPPQR